MPDNMHVLLVNMMYFNIYNIYVLDQNTVIPRLTSDPANEFFG